MTSNRNGNANGVGDAFRRTEQREAQTVRQLSELIGTQVGVRFEDLVIACKVCDAKNSWGKVRLLVVPVAGAGAQWVELTRLAAVSTQSELEAL